jgi:hypothetical protein
MRKSGLLLLPLALAGCQTWGPTWSEVTGARWNVPSKELNTVPTTINKIDGNSGFVNPPGQAIKVEPGTHAIELSAPPLSPGWTGGTNLETMQLTVEPCKRYYINGTYSNPVGMAWKPFVDYVDTIAGCKVNPAK